MTPGGRLGQAGRRMTDSDSIHPPVAGPAASTGPAAGGAAAGQEPAVSTAHPTASAGAQPAVLPRWARDTEHGLLGGVAAGLAGALFVDVAIVRVAFVVAALLHGAGILAYVAGWLALPALRDVRAGARPRRLRERQFAGVVFAAGALLVLVAPFELGAQIVLPALLIGVAIALWQSPVLRRGYPPVRERPPAGFSDRPAGPPPEPVDRAWLGAPVEPPSRLVRLTLGAMVLAEGAALLLDRAHALRLTSGGAASLALLVLGAGLTVGTVVGRGRLLALPALLLVPATVALVTFDRMGLDVFAPWGSLRTVAQTPEGIPPVVQLGAGTAGLDASAIDLAGASRSVTVESAMGDVQVWVPQDATVTVDAAVAIGRIDLGATGPSGVDRHLVTTLPGRSAAGTLHLRLRAGLGSVQVRRGRPDDVFAPPAPPPSAAPSPSPVPSPSPSRSA
jgi:phage shock protein PspC (stress-responsive transcriptional regulator)